MTSRPRLLDPRECRERGAALPMALGFLILFSVLIGIVFDYISSGMAANTQLTSQRDDISAANSAINAAVARIQADPAKVLGSTGSACGMPGVDVNGHVVDVNCTPDPNSGQAIPTTAAPPFAILTMAPFVQLSPATWSGNTPPNCVNVPPGELGVAQVQNSKLVTISGNVYVNSDADSDVWSGGCPQTTTAAHILVNGDVKQRSSCHDIDPTLDSYSWICGNGTATPQTPANPDAPLGGAVDPQLDDPAIAQPNSWALPFNVPPPVQPVPTCPAGKVVAFNPGTYDDAAALSTLMNGTTCPGRVFWFKPGAYYFNFTNPVLDPASHEWAINDGVARIIGGQPNAVVTGSTAIGPTLWTPQSATSSQFASPDSARVTDTTPATVQLGNIATGPTTWSPHSSAGSTFSTPDNALVIGDDVPATATLTNPAVVSGTWTAPVGGVNNGQPGGNAGFNVNPTRVVAIDSSSATTTTFTTGTRSTSLSGFTGTGAPVPPGATSITVSLTVAHNEGSTSTLRNLVNPPSITITPGGTVGVPPAACTMNVTKSTAANGGNPVSQTFNGLATCLDTPEKINGATVAYSVAHSATAGTAAPSVDGITITVGYTTSGVAVTSAAESLSQYAGSGAIPAAATVTAVTAHIRHAQGNTTLTNVPTVAIGGCGSLGLTLTEANGAHTDNLSSTNLTNCLTTAKINAGFTATYTATRCTGTGGGCTTAPVNISIDGVTFDVTYTIGGGISGTATVTLAGFASNPVSNIPNDAAITSVRLRVAHGEDNPAAVNNPTVTITPANSPACPAVSINKHAALTEDATPSYDVTSCLDDPAKIDNGVSLTYSVSRCSGCNGSVVRLDGVQLDITYAPNPRLPWDPNDPNANPNVPGACRHDGDPFWSDGVQWVFGGDSRLNVKSGQLELCDKPSLLHADPSLNKQEIVLFGVKGAPTVGPNTWAAPVSGVSNGQPGPNAGFDSNPTRVVAIDASSAATTNFTTGTRSTTLSGFTGIGAPVPAGATNLDVSLTVAHNEGNTATLRGLLNQPSITITPGGTTGPPPAACTMNVTKSTANNSNPISETFPGLTASCLDTPAKINGATVAYSVAHSATAGTAAPTLDGVAITVTYSLAAPGGALTPESGCVTQAPYYNPDDHSPAYNGACALVRVTRPAPGPQPAGDVRKVTFWGTVYAPSAAFDLPVDLMPVPVFNRGVVARMLMLGYFVASSTQIPFTTVPLTGGTPVDREATFTATVDGVTKITAHVRFCDTAPCGDKNSVVDSWVVTR